MRAGLPRGVHSCEPRARGRARCIDGQVSLAANQREVSAQSVKVWRLVRSLARSFVLLRFDSGGEVLPCEKAFATWVMFIGAFLGRFGLSNSGL